MWKKHHIAILVIAGIGVLYLIYKWYQNSVANASSSSTGTIDTSQLPTVISTGGGGYTPSTPSFIPQDFSQVAQPLSPTGSAADTSVTSPGTVTVMPNTSQSGVPTSSAQAQEFNTNNPMAAPSGAAATPSFYQNATQLAPPPSYADLSNQTYVQQTGGGTTLDLASYLAPDLQSYEIGANTAIGNKQALNSGITSLTPEGFQSALEGNANNYCSQHPEACAGDTNSIISGLVNSYKTFIGQDTAYLEPGSGAPAPSSTPVPTPSTTTTTLPPSRITRATTVNPVRTA